MLRTRVCRNLTKANSAATKNPLRATSASAAVLSTQPTVHTSNRRFLLARKSAHAPSVGMLSMTMA